VGPSAGPSLSHPQQQEQAQEHDHAWMTGPNGVPYVLSQGSSFNTGPLGPRGTGAEGKVVCWIWHTLMVCRPCGG
jgi:hypothetical protein